MGRTYCDDASVDRPDRPDPTRQRLPPTVRDGDGGSAGGEDVGERVEYGGDLHRFASWLIAENITLNEVAFDFPPPEEVREYSYLYPGKHLFDASWLGFTFPKRFLDCEIRQDAGALKLFMRRCPREFFQQPRTDFSLSSEIQLLLGKRFNEGLPSIEVAAELMHMTKRTLIRKLKEEGTSYQQIKDRLRRDKAVRLLSLNTLSVGQIAEKLGFSDSAVFARAFKAWTGASPSDYRRDEKARPGV